MFVSTTVYAVTTSSSSFKTLQQLRPARGPVEGFVRLSLGFHCSISILNTDNLSYFDNLDFHIFDAGAVLTATLLDLLPLQLGIEHFQYIDLN